MSTPENQFFRSTNISSIKFMIKKLLRGENDRAGKNTPTRIETSIYLRKNVIKIYLNCMPRKNGEKTVCMFQ